MGLISAGFNVETPSSVPRYRVVWNFPNSTRSS